MAVLDIANTFLHANNNNTVNMLFRGKLAEIMVRIYPALYRDYVTYSANRILILYVRLSKVLYEMLRDVLLFYKRL